MHELVKKFRKSRSRNSSPIIAISAGSGQISQYAVEAGADLLLALNAGLYRTAGSGSLASFLAYGNANEQTDELLRRHILPNSRGLPVVAGVMASDPTIDIDQRFDSFHRLGVSGVTNWPTAGFVDGTARLVLEEEGCGIDLEVELLRRARERGLATFAFVLTQADVQKFVDVGVDALIINAGLTPANFATGDRRDAIQSAIGYVNRMVETLGSLPARPLCLVYGGPFTDVDDFSSLFQQAEVDGIAGGSVFERLPVQAITSNFMRRCKALKVTAPDPGLPERHAILGRSAACRDMMSMIERVAPFDVNILIEGETGVGKEMAATLIHQLSPRSNQPFITLNCGAIPAGLLESELFGHERGAFTGADRRRTGKFELANRGTLLLDEIADLSPAAQVALLRVLQQREVVRVGGDNPIPLNVRVVAATNQPLAGLVREGKFRSDLYYRISTVTLDVPALRDRADDIPLLVSAFLHRTATELGIPALSIDERFEQKLLRHSWPGNIRELMQVISRAAILEDGPVLRGLHFHPDGGAGLETSATISARRVSSRDIQEALKRANGNKSIAAAELGISRKTLYAKLMRADHH